MKKLTIFVLFLCYISAVHAQMPSPNRTTIKGFIKDTNNNAAAFATVMLLNPGDSTLLNFTQSNVDGAFTFNNIKNTPYLLKVSHISFLPLQVFIPESASEINDLGIVRIRPILAELMEVVIRTAKAPLMIRGDTIEYDATMFKVPPGSTVEDLLRRLPGIEVDAQGNIKTQGKDVDRIYVDGKSFFGDDPKNATKNLDAEAISKVQVFDEKSEQAKLTGIDDGSKEKAMNLQLKEEYKKGSFGKVTAAGGTMERWAGRGNYNRFNEKQQLSFIGYANNINETGVNWEDYSEFKGQNSFTEYDNGDFGFSTGGNYIMYSEDEMEVPMNNFDGKGFTKNYGGGVNYNFDNTKTKFNTNYFYHYSDLTYNSTSFQETFLGDSSFINRDTLNFNSGRGGHSGAMRLEQKIDSNNTIIAKVNFRYSDGSQRNIQNSWYADQTELPTNFIFLDDYTGDLSWRANATAIYNHKFKKAGRSFALSAGYNRSQGDNDENTLSRNTFYDLAPFTTAIHQAILKNSDKEQIKASALYTEPLSKKFFLETFYNFNLTTNQVNRQATAPQVADERIDSLSMYYSNESLANRVGVGIRFANNGLNLMMGVAGQRLELNGKYSVDVDEPLLTEPLNKVYLSIGPKVQLNYEFANGMYLNAEYGYSLSEPSFSDLQPITIMTSPNYRREGNPNLVPERAHDFSVHTYYRNPSSFASVGFGINGSYILNNITYNRNILWVDSIGYVTTTKPDNTTDGYHLSGWLWSDIPLIKTKLNLTLNGYTSFNNSGAYVNDELNSTLSKNFNFRPGFKITPTQKLIVELSAGISYRNINYSISKDQNQDIFEYSGDVDLKWQFAKKSFFEANFDYYRYLNEKYGFYKDMPIFNASVRQLIGKTNRFQIRLAAFDIFDKRFDIQEYGSSNYVIRSLSPTLARYFMLSVSYNLKGFENKLKKNGFW